MNKDFNPTIEELKRRNEEYIESYNERIHQLIILRKITFFIFCIAIFIYIEFLVDVIKYPSIYYDYHLKYLYVPYLMGLMWLHTWSASRKFNEEDDLEPYLRILQREKSNLFFQSLTYFGIFIYSYFVEKTSLYTFSAIGITFLFYAFYATTILVMTLKPKLLTSGVLNGIGTLSYYITFLTFGFYIFFHSYDLGDQNEINPARRMIFLIVILITFITAIYYLLKVQRRNSYNLLKTQSDTIKIIEPKKLLYYLRKEPEILKDKSIAKEIIDTIENDYGYGVQVEVAKILINKRTNRKKLLLGAIITLLIFIICSIGEGFFQDLLYEPFLKPLFFK